MATLEAASKPNNSHQLATLLTGASSVHVCFTKQYKIENLFSFGVVCCFFRVFFMDVPNDSVLERLTQRATDPVTGERYHLLYNPPRTVEIKERLQLHPKDAEDCVRKRVAAYSTFADEMADFYEDMAQRVNADQDPHTVFENIESLIVLPLPKRLVIL